MVPRVADNARYHLERRDGGGMDSDLINYEDAARDAIDGMLPNSKRVAHYRGFNGSPVKLYCEILKLSEVDTAPLEAYDFKRFSITIETK